LPPRTSILYRGRSATGLGETRLH